MFGAASHLEVHTLKPSTSNRLRRSGLSSGPAICLAAGALACALAGEAQAAIVASGPVNIAASTGNISIAGAPQFALTNVDYKSTRSINLVPVSADFAFVGSGSVATKLGSGENIYSGRSFSNNSSNNVIVSNTSPNNWTGSGDAYIGFKFSPSVGQTRYGWAHIQYTDTDSPTLPSLTLLDYSYEDSGAAITTPVPVPVPTLTQGWMILFGAVLAGVAAVTIQRRRLAT